jgi:hypothetical protein
MTSDPTTPPRAAKRLHVSGQKILAGSDPARPRARRLRRSSPAARWLARMLAEGESSSSSQPDEAAQ